MFDKKYAGYYNIDMEIEELVQVEENQISFDFLDTPLTEKLPMKDKWEKTDTLVIILKPQGQISCNFDLCGRKIIDFVIMATASCQQKILDDVGQDNVLSLAKQNCENFDYVSVLYADTPLLQGTTFSHIMDEFAKSGKNVSVLERGYVFRSTYLQNAKMLLSTAVDDFAKEEFLQVNSPATLAQAFEVLNQRILDYHMSQGVIFFGKNTIFIDVDVEIEAGTIVYSNNVLKGQTYIGKNVILESGNYILDTIVCDDAFVVSSYLEKSKVEKGKIVGPFERLVNEKI